MSTMEERIEEAIVEKFFEPAWMSLPQQVLNPQTNMYETQVMLVQSPSPMSIIAKAIYDQARTEIIQKVIARMDVDAIVAEWSPLIAKDVVDQLNKTPERWSSSPSKSEREKMMDKVYQAVADEFGRQCVEHLKNTGGLTAILEA